MAQGSGVVNDVEVAARAPLGSSATPPTPREKRQQNRAYRTGLRKAGRGLTDHRRLNLCGYALGNVPVTIDSEFVAHVGGVGRCASTWACAVCAPIIREQRAQQLQAGFDALFAAGGGGVFATFTLPHHLGDELGPRLGLLCRALGRVLTGRPWEKLAARIGYLGAVRAVEVTYGENGHHPHLHVALCTSTPLSAEQQASVAALLFRRWEKYVALAGFGQISEEHGVDVRPITSAGVGQYLAKVQDTTWGVGRELARFDRKGSSVFNLLALFAATGEKRYAAAWIEYVEATYGRKAVVVSRKLSHLFRVDELTDEELATVEAAEPIGTVWFSKKHWNWITHTGQEPAVLDELERAAEAIHYVATFGGTRDGP